MFACFLITALDSTGGLGLAVGFLLVFMPPGLRL